MKKTVLLLAMMAAMMTACNRGGKTNETNDEWAIDENAQVEAIFDLVQRDTNLKGCLSTLCTMAEWWIELPFGESQDEFLRNAQDMYNGYMLVNTVVADYEIWERENTLEDPAPFLDTIIMAIRDVNVDVLQSPELRSKGEKFVKNMVWCMEHPKNWTDSRCPSFYIEQLQEYVHNRYAAPVMDQEKIAAVSAASNHLIAAKKPVQEEIAALDDVARFGAQMDSICHAESFTEQCAIALACCNHVETFHGMQTLWQLKAMMTSGEYSPLLCEIWVRWRAFLQTEVFGNSRDSYIPNDAYDAVRKIFFTTIVNHISENPDDMLAKTLAALLAETQGLIRNGCCMFGNNAVYDLAVFCPDFYGDGDAEEEE